MVVDVAQPPLLGFPILVGRGRKGICYAAGFFGFSVEFFRGFFGE